VDDGSTGTATPIARELAAIRKELRTLRQLGEFEGKLLPISDKAFREVRQR
jgi:hypothetical protein